MWNIDKNTNKWIKIEDTLSKDKYDQYAQDMESYRLYSKCLSGSIFNRINKFNDIYEELKYLDNKSWYITDPYNEIIIKDNPIDSSDESTIVKYRKYLLEYGFSKKGLFTPTKLINDTLNNFLKVDFATTTYIDVTKVYNSLTIDGILVKDGQKVLIKDQTTIISNDSIPLVPLINYYPLTDDNPHIEEDMNIEDYSTYFNKENGIYTYTNSQLVRDEDIYNSYINTKNNSVFVNNGVDNKFKQFHLLRYKNGYFPVDTDNDPSYEYEERHNWILRNQVDYNNVYDRNYYDIITHNNESYIDNNETFIIPKRTIVVGEFGMILNTQTGSDGNEATNIIDNKYKVNLLAIANTSKFYWITGENGTLLRVSKLNFNIEKVELNEFNDITDIEFIDDNRGFIVGKFNTIYHTNDGGYNWEKLTVAEFDAFNYNKIYYHNLTTVYIGGDNGVFIELTESSNNWQFYKRNIIKRKNNDDEYLLVDDVKEIIYSEINNWDIYIIDADNNVTINSDPKPVLIIGTINGNTILYDKEKSITTNDEFYYLEYETKLFQEDIKNLIIINKDLYVNADNVYKFNISNFNTIKYGTNIIDTDSSTQIPLPLYPYYYNKIITDTVSFIACGNSSLYRKGLIDQTLFDVDQSFLNRFKSKLLFLDYDIASKLNFIDDSGNYRLPDNIIIDLNSIINDYIHINNIDGEENWISYYKDAEKTFSYYTDMNDNNKIEFSTYFTKETMYSQFVNYSKLTYNTPNRVAYNINDIINIIPNANNYKSSNIYPDITPISEPTNNYDIFISKNIIVFKTDINHDYKKGDILLIDNSLVKCTFMINNVIDFGPNRYLYANHTLNNNIIVGLSKLPFIEIFNLNRWVDLNDLIYRFNEHPISYGYSMIGDNASVTISPRFNNKTAYYNMQYSITYDDINYINRQYNVSNLTFGYTPTYNILNYLSSIDSNIFVSSKQFTTMPRYSGMAGNNGGNATIDNIYIDTSIESNKLLFGENFKFHWDTLWVNTFVDVNLTTSTNTYLSERLLIMDKYETEEGYVIEFNKKMKYNYGDNITLIDVLSRNTLGMISDDLQNLNNIQRSSKTKNGKFTDTYISLENDIYTKPYTDSYCKILLSDKDIKKNLTGIIYTDDDYELALNVINLDIEVIDKISYTSEYNGYARINCVNPHNLFNNDGVVLQFSGDNTSYELNRNYIGYQIIQVIDDYSFYINVPFGTTTGAEDGYFRFIKKDPFFNFIPVDLINVDVDKKIDRAIEIKPQNYELKLNIWNLVDVDLSNYRYRLVDDMTVDILSDKYSWIYEAEITNAVIGQKNNTLVWYTGNWRCGRWFGGEWISGNWISGDWYSGMWKSLPITDNITYITVGNTIDINRSKWFGGRWFGGEVNGGKFYNVRFYAGLFNNAIFYNGIWNDGTFTNSEFIGGIWVLGRFRNSLFNCINKPAYWLDGSFENSDFQNGMWYNGTFTTSRFGTLSSNSRPSIWRGGNWLSGQMHSRLNLDSNNKPIESLVHKYTRWESGLWNGGDWYGGIALNINAKQGYWYSGIVLDIQIINVEVSSNTITLNGDFYFNINDEIYIIDNESGSVYSNIGSSENIGKYKIANIIRDFDPINNIKITKLILNYNLSSLFSTIPPPLSVNGETGLRLVSNYENTYIKNAIIKNAILGPSTTMESGMFYNGVIQQNSNWGT